MGILNLRGQVKYADLTPVANIRIKIRDLDLGPGGGNDLIFDKVTRADGTFSGLSSEWVDREGVIRVGFFEQNIPDILNLEFEVEGHKGPYVRVGNNSVPIILPIGHPKPVTRDNRELVQIVFLAEAKMPLAEEALYSIIETGSAAVVDTFLGNDYKTVHRIQGANATLAKFKEKLILAGTSANTKAVDVVFCTHGLTNGLAFADQTATLGTLQTMLLSISPAIRSKFRMVFSTACYGDSHADTWIAGGFACVSGSEEIYADSQVSFAPFLHSWETNNTFSGSIATANNADPLDLADNIAKAYYRSMPAVAGLANQINSNRIVTGNGDVRIYSKPR